MNLRAKEPERPRVLIIDTKDGEHMQSLIREKFPVETRVRVVLARNHERLERLCRTKATNWRFQEVEKLRHFDCVAVNASADWRTTKNEPENPLSYAIALAEKKTPVLVYSPDFNGQRLSKLKSYVEGPFTAAFDLAAIPDAALLSLTAPKVARKTIALLKLIRTTGGHADKAADKAREHMKKLLGKLSAETRELCLRILAYEENGTRFAMA